MAKLIGVSGPQGSGKSTLLAALSGKLENVIVDNFKVSRSVQQEQGVTKLTDGINGSFEDIFKFQTRILDVKMQYDAEQLNRTDADIILVDRTYIDIWAYTQIWITQAINKNPHNTISDTQVTQLIHFTTECVTAQANYSGIVYVPFMPHIKWENDDNRAEFSLINDFNSFAEIFMKTSDSLYNIPCWHIKEKSIDSRVEETIKFITSLQKV